MMNKLIKKIFIESGHSEEQLENEFLYFSLQDLAYFFVIDFDQTEFDKIQNRLDIDAHEKYNRLKQNYEKLVSEGVSNTVEKNSSLIVLVKVDSLSALEKYQQQILLFEEDEYFFKKYVILYSDESIKDMIDKDNLISILQTKVKDETKFDSYANGGFQDELEEYLLILQLYIKLPFLKLSYEGNPFQTLASKISNELGDIQEALYNQLSEISEEIQNIDFELEDNENEIDKVLKLLPND